MIPVFKSRKDRLRPYFDKLLNSFIFTEISPEFLKASGFPFMEGVPVPVHSDDVKPMAGSGLSAAKLADNMAQVIGADTHFKYADKYLQYLNKMFDEKLVSVFAGKAEESLKIGNYRKGMAYLRAGMMFRGDSLQAMFTYAFGCRYWYLQMEGTDDDQELVAILKSEANEYFEHITSAYPEFARGWYFLGYSYINQGQYQKAQIAWKHYMTAALNPAAIPGIPAESEEDKKEIETRLSELEDPVKIEKGISLLMEGQTVDALRILEPYTQTGYAKWWPLHFNLAEAYRDLGYIKEAEEGYLNVLKLAPSNADAMERLAELYAEAGQADKAEKYYNKAELVRKND